MILILRQSACAAALVIHVSILFPFHRVPCCCAVACRLHDRISPGDGMLRSPRIQTDRTPLNPELFSRPSKPKPTDFSGALLRGLHALCLAQRLRLAAHTRVPSTTPGDVACSWRAGCRRQPCHPHRGTTVISARDGCRTFWTGAPTLSTERCRRGSEKVVPPACASILFFFVCLAEVR